MNGAAKVTRLTAPGRGAVAVIRANMTAAAAEHLDSCFRAANSMLPSQAAIGRILYGLWDGEDVVVVRVSDHDWEIHCHGGDAAVERISRQLTQEAQSSAPAVSERADEASEEPLEHAVLNQLLTCRTARTASFLLTQYTGGLRRFLTSLSDEADTGAADAVLRDHLQWRGFAAHLTRPWRVAVIGQPNAGKSSLLNSIIGYERSIVFDHPGTTRDLVETELILDGWPFSIVDTAGIRANASNDVEAIGVESAFRSVASCDACLLVVDSQSGWTHTDAELAETVPDTCQFAVLWNKVDLSPEESTPSSEMTGAARVVETSAIDGSGIEELIAWLPAALVPATPETARALPVVESLADELTDYVDRQSGTSLQDILAGWL